MIATIALATVLFAAQIAAYVLIRRSLARRAAYKRRLGSLVVPQPVARYVAPHAHNRPGEN
jgi:hypothetical protein